jgi:LCP family protein required for cell wall assembly
MSHEPRPSLFARALVASLAAALLLASCGPSATPSPSSSSESQARATPAATASGAPSASASAAPPRSASAAPSATAGGSGLGSDRLNVLFVGIDNTTERERSELTDSMIVASLDPLGQTVSLLALPRDLTDFPLPSGATYREKLNSVYAEIQANPKRFGGKTGEEPLEILAEVVGNLVDLPIDHWIAVDMDGFAKLVDALGGVDVYVQDAVCDPRYQQLGVRGFEAPAGWWHLTGPQALGLARVRHNAGGSDFQRVRRQMALLVAIRDRIVAKGAAKDPLGWLKKVPAIRTDLSPGTILAAGAAVATINPARFNRRVIEPGAGNGGVEGSDSRGYVLEAQMGEIRDIAGLLFTDPGTRPTTGRFQALPPKPATVKNLPRFNGC